MLKIIKINQGIFTVFEKGIKGSEIVLDFNPFVKKHDLRQGLIIHLRARPPQQACHWTYGIYEVEFDNYLSIDNIESDSQPQHLPKFFSACISKLETKPTHVLIYPESLIEYSTPRLISIKNSNAVAETVSKSALKKALK